MIFFPKANKKGRLKNVDLRNKITSFQCSLVDRLESKTTIFNKQTFRQEFQVS